MTRLSDFSNHSTPLSKNPASAAAAHYYAPSCFADVKMSGSARYEAQASLMRAEAITGMVVYVRDALRNRLSKRLKVARATQPANQGTGTVQRPAKSTDRVRAAPGRTHQLFDDSGVTGFGL